MEFKTKRRQRCVARLIFVVGIFFFFCFWMCVLCWGCFCVRDHVSCRRQDVYFAPQKKKPKTFAKKREESRAGFWEKKKEERRRRKKAQEEPRHQRLTGARRCVHCPQKSAKREKGHTNQTQHTREKLGSRGKEKKPQREG